MIISSAQTACSQIFGLLDSISFMKTVTAPASTTLCVCSDDVEAILVNNLATSVCNNELKKN